ncbi:MAG: hypothetical protein JWL84_2730 [Rhodospirillales bacterium]|jgi:hypothetical protein|nr:hypothetical protein [Rhodospirillales bacterium]
MRGDLENANRMAEFFESRALRYEIHLLVDKRWQITEIAGNGGGGGPLARVQFEEFEKSVLAKANAMLAAGVKAVRVMRDRIRSDGFTTTTELFFKEATNAGSEPPLTVGRYEGAPPLCTKPEDIASRASCQVIGVVLRSFLDKQLITALELLHLHPYLRKLNENYTLVQGALHQIATSQAKTAGSDLKSRVTLLLGLIDAVEAKAREAMAEKRLPAIEQDFRKFAERMAARYDGDQRRFYAAVGIARHFQGSQSFLAKLDFALDHLPDEPLPEMRSLLDELAAGCLDSSQLVMDLLGHQPSLAAALMALADLASGRGETEDKSGSLKRLREAIAAGILPSVVDSLWHRVLRELGRGRPLSRSDEKQEWGLLMKLSDHLVGCCPGDARPAVEDAVKLRLRRLRDSASMRE